jgi:DNA-binding transcriptional regulator YhcF (GntR family)
VRIWITRNSEVPIREQLVRQVTLGILSEDLPAGTKLPSIRALARQHHIHSNTVSAAFHDWLDRGWLELRRGSGLYVRPRQPGAEVGELDALLVATLRAAHGQGHEPEEVLHRLTQLIRPRQYDRVIISEPDGGLAEILQTELREHLRVPVEAVDPRALSQLRIGETCLVTALATCVGEVRRLLPRGVHCMTLRLRSVRGSLEGNTRPGPDALISIVSGSSAFRHWARAMLIAVGLKPDALFEVDTALADWRERAHAASMSITDAVACRQIPADRPARVFRIIADLSMDELRQLGL